MSIPTIMHGVGTLVPMACVPSNTLLSGPFDPVIQLITGGFGGLLQTLAIGMAVLLAFLAIATILSRKAGTFMKLVAFVLAIPVGLVIILALYSAVFNGINDSVACA